MKKKYPPKIIYPIVIAIILIAGIYFGYQIFSDVPHNSELKNIYELRHNDDMAVKYISQRVSKYPLKIYSVSGRDGKYIIHAEKMTVDQMYTAEEYTLPTLAVTDIHSITWNKQTFTYSKRASSVKDMRKIVDGISSNFYKGRYKL